MSSLALGAAYGTARSGVGIAGIGPFRPELVMKVGIHHLIRSMPSHQSFCNLMTCLITLVSYTRRHEWYYRSIWTCGCCVNSRTK